MLFNSFPFLFVYLPIVLVGFHLLGQLGRRPVIAWLSIASVVFYWQWNHSFVVLLLASAGMNFGISRWIAATEGEGRRRLLVLGVSLNLLALFYFKYLFKLLSVIATWRGTEAPHSILLPLGISFFTFTQISYLVDLAQGQAEEQDFLSYLLFVTFFPHLIAGPILHHKEMMPQFAEGRRFGVTADDFSIGFTWFVVGLAKKVLIADFLAATADSAFAQAGVAGAWSAWSGLIVYSMQLYFDFSGYSDMAIGLARMFGVRFPMNFRSPWKATSVTEYWQRWHMTLTRYVTLYLYNPILLSVQRARVAAGKKTSRKALATPGGFVAMVAYPTMVTMLLTGVWHGAGLQFVIFGALHGVYLTAALAWRHFHKPPERSNEFWVMPMRVGMYLQVIFALIFFRADSLRSAMAYCGDLIGRRGTGIVAMDVPVLLAIACFPVVWYLPNTQQFLGEEAMDDDEPSAVRTLRWQRTLPWALATGVVFFATLVLMDQHSSFLYFQF